MRKSSFCLVLLIGICVIFSCSEKRGQEQLSNDFSLEIIDSIQVDYLGQVNAADFQKGKGLFFDRKTNTLLLFDSIGKILQQKTFPSEGPESVSYIGGMRFQPSGKIVVTTLVGDIALLREDLSLERKIQMPFPTELRDMMGNARTFDFYENKILIFYPGRNGKNPYLRDFWRENPLIEQVDLEAGKVKPMIRLSPESKHQSDFYYERPFPKVAIHGNLLYLHLDTESLITVYDLEKDGELLETLDFSPSKYVQWEGQKEQVGYVSGNFMSRARSHNVYALPQGLIIHYDEGITQDDFMNAGLKDKNNWYKIPDIQKEYLRIYEPELGWSNEIIVPPIISMIMNIEDLDKAFYAIRSDEYLGEEQEYVTLYKLRLKRNR